MHCEKTNPLRYGSLKPRPEPDPIGKIARLESALFSLRWDMNAQSQRGKS